MERRLAGIHGVFNFSSTMNSACVIILFTGDVREVFDVTALTSFIPFTNNCMFIGSVERIRCDLVRSMIPMRGSQSVSQSVTWATVLTHCQIVPLQCGRYYISAARVIFVKSLMKNNNRLTVFIPGLPG